MKTNTIKDLSIPNKEQCLLCDKAKAEGSIFCSYHLAVETELREILMCFKNLRRRASSNMIQRTFSCLKTLKALFWHMRNQGDS